MNNEIIDTAIGERFGEALKLKYGEKNNTLIANKWAYTPQAIGQLKKKKAINETIAFICEKENINLNWIQSGRGQVFIDIEEELFKVNVDNSNKISNKDGNVAVNGSININRDDYSNFEDVKELLALLKEAPKSWIPKLNDKIKKSLNKIDEIF
ncbi:hypothetical protein [Aliarcobacter butzleri]|uniref:hypothetical protein n=1 Tax=Aliarcobacter butzleri TaxID=28197 RepID=UPI003BA79137